MPNPLAYVARRWTPSPALVRRAALATVVMSVVIVVTGGAVRLTSSGLGCPTWPTCTGDSLAPTEAMGVHGAIEFANRMLTDLLCAVVGFAIVTSRAAKPRRHGLTRLGWAQFWVVMSNAVVGGITVLTGLNPYSVAVHFLAAMALVTVAVLMWQRSGEGDAEPRPLVGKPVRQLGRLLLAACGALLTVGTAVTGAGPHAGDSSAVARIPIDWQTVAQLHADLAWIVCGLSLALWFALRAVEAPPQPRARVRDLLLVLLGQGVVGYVQYATGLPGSLVGVHMLGSALVWIAALRVVLAMRERPAAKPPAGPAAAPAAAPAAVPAQSPAVSRATPPAPSDASGGLAPAPTGTAPTAPTG